MNFAAFITWLSVTLAPFGYTGPVNATTDACEPAAQEANEERCAASNEKSGDEESDEPGRTLWNPAFFISNGF